MAAEDLLFTIMFTLGIGTFFMHHLSKLKVPYTVVMFLFGIVLGTLGFFLPKELSESFDTLAEMPPRMIFHIFLPILIFEGAYGMKIHAFRQVFWQIVLLAGPGLIINTMLVAAPIKWFLFPEWNWFAVILLGGLLSATDPVAVVALLKDLGVDKRVTAMLDGEAIMNDGTAIIVVTLFQPAASLGEMEGTNTGLFVRSLQLTLGAVAFGLFWGVIQVFCMKRCHNDLTKTCVSIACAFMSFFLADEVLETSGVLTLCFQGVYLAMYYPSLFPGKEGSLLNSTWHWLVHFANTIVFALVGMIIVRDAARDFTFMDFWYIIFLYITIVLARLIMLYMFMPLLNCFSFKVGRNDILLFVHGGLRGAVAVTLALIVFTDPLIPRAMGIDFLVLTCGVVLLTTTVNATTSDKVVIALGHKTKESNRIVQMNAGHKHILAESDRVLRHIKSLKFVRRANWSNIVPLLEHIENPYAGMSETIEDEEVIFKSLLMRTFKTSVWRMRDANRISEEVVVCLTKVASDCLRKKELITTVQLHPEMRYSFFVSVFQKVGPCAEGLVRYMKGEKDKENFGVLLAYAEALDDVEQALSSCVHTKTQLVEAHGWLHQERERIMEKTMSYLEEKPLTAMSVITKNAAEMAINQTLETVEALHEGRGFSIPATEALHHAVEHVRDSVKSLPNTMEPMTVYDVFRLSRLNPLPDLCIHDICRHCSVVEYSEGEEIILQTPSSSSSLYGGAVRPNSSSSSAFSLNLSVSNHKPTRTEEDPSSLRPTECHLVAIVESGAVTILGRDDVTFGSGAVFGLDWMMTNKKCAAKLHAMSHVTLHTISVASLQSIADETPILKEKLLLSACIEMCESLFSKTLFTYQHWKYDHIIDMLEENPRLVYVPTNNYVVPRLSGEVHCFITGKDSTGLLGPDTPPCILPNRLQLKWEADTIIFVVKVKQDYDASATSAMRRRALTSALDDDDNEMKDMDHHGGGREISIITNPSEGGGLYANAQQQMSAPSRRAALFYNPEEFVTPYTYFNALQVNYLLQLQNFEEVVQDYRDFPQEHRTIIAVGNSIDHIISFASRFTVQYFSKEMKIYEESNANKNGGEGRVEGVSATTTTTILPSLSMNIREQRKAHEKFQSMVSHWAEVKANDELPFQEILEGLDSFARQHFPQDQRDLRATAAR